MAKRIALKDHISVDAVDLSQFARCVEFSSEHERVDVSGFHRHGRERVPRRPNRAVRHHRVLRRLRSHRDTPDPVPDPLQPRSRRVRVAGRPDRSRLSAPTPSCEGNVQLLTYNPSATRGEAETWEATFVAADSAGLTYHTT